MTLRKRLGLLLFPLTLALAAGCPDDGSHEPIDFTAAKPEAREIALRQVLGAGRDALAVVARVQAEHQGNPGCPKRTIERDQLHYEGQGCTSNSGTRHDGRLSLYNIESVGERIKLGPAGNHARATFRNLELTDKGRAVRIDGEINQIAETDGSTSTIVKLETEDGATVRLDYDVSCDKTGCHTQIGGTGTIVGVGSFDIDMKIDASGKTTIVLAGLEKLELSYSAADLDAKGCTRYTLGKKDLGSFCLTDGIAK